jgi:hypothetical protein
LFPKRFFLWETLDIASQVRYNGTEMREEPMPEQNPLQAVLDNLQEVLAHYPMSRSEEATVYSAYWYLREVQKSGVIESYNEVK